MNHFTRQIKISPRLSLGWVISVGFSMEKLITKETMDARKSRDNTEDALLSQQLNVILSTCY